MPEFRLGFAALARLHPEVGEAVSDEFEIGPLIGQWATLGLLLYDPVHRIMTALNGQPDRGWDAVIAQEGYRLRAAPSTEAQVVMENLPVGTPVHGLLTNLVTGSGHFWGYIQLLDRDGVEGWVAEEAWDQPAPPTPDDGLTDEPNHQFTLAELWPAIQAACAEMDFDAKVLAAICNQESGFRNWLLHADGQGRGLMGLDPRGLLSEFEQWSGIKAGPNSAPNSLPVVPQFRYAAKRLHESTGRVGFWNAVRSWHTGEGNFESGAGRNYEALVRKWFASLDFPA